VDHDVDRVIAEEGVGKMNLRLRDDRVADIQLLQYTVDIDI
jgi:hypothetical protein